MVSSLMEFSADIESLPQMLGHVRSFLNGDQIQKSTLQDIELACEEALVNIIMHGHAERAPIMIECERKAQTFEVTIRDRGIAFNPTDVEIDPRVDRPLDERKVGGLGLYLMRRLAHEISYMRKDEENILKIGFLL